MHISKDKVVAIHYTLTNTKGEVIDSSHKRNEALKYIHGRGNLIPGMEEGLEGRSVGDKLNLEIPPEKGYGERNDDAIMKVERAKFGDADVQVGMQFQAGPQVVTVVEVSETEVTVDANHALAGEVLMFDVEVMEVRDADASELDHGHVH